MVPLETRLLSDLTMIHTRRGDRELDFELAGVDR